MKPNGNNNLPPSIPASPPGGWLEIVRRQVATLQFGIVQIMVHESKGLPITKPNAESRPDEPRTGSRMRNRMRNRKVTT